MLLMIAVVGGMLLALLDQTIVTTALPRITAELGGTAGYGWVVTAYLLAITASGPLYGRLSDRYGRRPLLLTGITVFLTGSALCATAASMPQLIAYRAVQGLGAGALMPLCLALAAETYPEEKRGAVQGMLGAVMAVSYVGGPLAGGFLTDHAGWRWVFLVNLPIGAVILALIATRVPKKVGAERIRPDYAGIAVFVAAVSALLIGLDRTEPWLVLLAVPLGGLFLLIETRAAEPLLPLRLFRNRAYTTASIGSFGGAFALYGAIVLLPRYFQAVRHISATSSGVQLYPLLLGMVAGSAGTGWAIGRTHRYRPSLAAGAVLLLAGAALITTVTAPAMLLIGLGIGPTMSGLTVVIQGSVPPAHLGVATSNLGFFRQVGGALTLALAAHLGGGLTSNVAVLVGVGATILLFATAAMPEAAKSRNPSLSEG
jgi:EmrB/QacA subfamily drug resistance transporter